MNRFDLEQAILACSQTADDISLVVEEVMEGDMEKDRVVNALLGIRELTKLRCDKAFSIFSEMIRSGT